MDRSQALQCLRGGKTGILRWNKHREAGMPIPSLRAVNLSGAELALADLRGADLRKARLSRAHLFAAKLSGANLESANLAGANLRASELSAASLKRANLVAADLSMAELVATDFAGATCDKTTFGDVDLSLCHNLHTIMHTGVSYTSSCTIVKSRGRIPESFLSGCGVPQEWITFLPSLVNMLDPIQFNSCFISYSTRDQEFAKKLHSRMMQERLRVWYAPDAMQGGVEIYGQIDGAIQTYDKLLLVLSTHSMQSNWVKTEIRSARRKEKRQERRVLFPIRLVNYNKIESWKLFDPDEGLDLAAEIRALFIPDFSKWEDDASFEEAFAGLVKALRASETNE